MNIPPHLVFKEMCTKLSDNVLLVNLKSVRYSLVLGIVQGPVQQQLQLVCPNVCWYIHLGTCTQRNSGGDCWKYTDKCKELPWYTTHHVFTCEFAIWRLELYHNVGYNRFRVIELLLFSWRSHSGHSSLYVLKSPIESRHGRWTRCSEVQTWALSIYIYIYR